MRAPVQLGCALLAVASTLAAAGCARLHLDTVRRDVAAGQGTLIDAVPFIAQEAFQCGPASLAMVLQYYGAAVTQTEISQALYLPSIKGTLNLDLEFYARRRGFQARSFASTLDAVKAELRQAHPLIVFQDLGIPAYPVPHFAVVIGYDDRAQALVLHSGLHPYQLVSYAVFQRSWGRRAWTLLVTPAPA